MIPVMEPPTDSRSTASAPPPTTGHVTLMDRHRAATRSVWVSVVVNFFLSTAQIIVGFFAHSQALIADGIHTLSDLFADFIVLGANKISRAGADEDHPYGHARFETAASLALGLLLLIVGVGMLWAAAHKLVDPSSIPQVHHLALWAALITLVSKEGLFRYMLAIAKRVNSTMLIANAWHARADAASSLVVAIGIGGNLMGYTFLDPLAAALVGFMICRTGGKFAWDAMARLTDRGMTPAETEAVRATFAATPGVKDVHDLKTRYMGDEVLIDAHLLVDNWLSVSEGHYIAAHARRRVLASHRALDALVHIDPEDDQSGEQLAELPPREKILACLYSHLGDVSPQAQPPVLIHYLHRTVDLDIFIGETDIDGTSADVLRRVQESLPSLRQAIPMLGRVQVWRSQESEVRD
ncbi:MAG: cation diffusion facilitator family transporter [Proteobacteria bacterium]|nr:cation diffusion facilitator family transporter [Pseudomonadota bacterium]MCL2307523.1 cation diffusion facilitator family transporter [Pseudomonadota bacterium]